MSKDSIINEVKLMMCKNQYGLLRRSVWGYSGYKFTSFSKCKYKRYKYAKQFKTL